MTTAQKMVLAFVLVAMLAVAVTGLVLYGTDRTFRIVFDPMLQPFRGEATVQNWCGGALSFALNTPRAIGTYALYKYYDRILRENGIDGRG